MLTKNKVIIKGLIKGGIPWIWWVYVSVGLLLELIIQGNLAEVFIRGACRSLELIVKISHAKVIVRVCCMELLVQR